MPTRPQGAWKPGRGPTIECAAEDAWSNAKQGIAARGKTTRKAEPGTYKVEISISASNPIRSYIVTILPPDG